MKGRKDIRMHARMVMVDEGRADVWSCMHNMDLEYITVQLTLHCTCLNDKIGLSSYGLCVM
jgi:hypothetical protein